MQVAESEFVIPLKYKLRLRKFFIRLCISFVFYIGSLTFLIVLTLQIIAGTSRFPDIQDMAHTLMVFSLVLLALALFFYGLFFTYLFRQWRQKLSPQLRINHEGIFFSSLSLLIRWEEIRELSPFSFGRSPFFVIVPWDAESIAARIKASSKRWFRFGPDLNQWIVRLPKSPALFGVEQKALSTSVDELIAAIQKYFADELHKHHITVLGWQQSPGEH